MKILLDSNAYSAFMRGNYELTALPGSECLLAEIEYIRIQHRIGVTIS